MNGSLLLIIFLSSWNTHAAPAQDYLLCKEGQQRWRGQCDNWCWCVGEIVLCDLCYVDFTFTANLLRQTPEENGLSTVLVAPTAVAESFQVAVADEVLAYKLSPQLSLLSAIVAAVDSEDYYEPRRQFKATEQRADMYPTTFDTKIHKLVIDHMNALHPSNYTAATENNLEQDFIQPVPVAQSKPAHLYENTLFYPHLVKAHRLNSPVTDDVHVSEVVTDEETSAVPFTSNIEGRRLEILQLLISVLQDLKTNYSLEGISLNVYPNVRSINIDNVQLIDRDSNRTDIHNYDLEHPNDLRDDCFAHQVYDYDYDNSMYLSIVDANDTFVSHTPANPFNSTVLKSITLKDVLDVMIESATVAQNETLNVPHNVSVQAKLPIVDWNYLDSNKSQVSTVSDVEHK